MDDIIYEDSESGENTKGHISGAPSQTTKTTWGMPDVGDDGGTKVTKVDWVLFASIANATSVLSKGALDETIAQDLLDKSSGQDYDAFISKVDRFFGNPESGAQYNTITTNYLAKKTTGSPLRIPSFTKFIALQYPLSGEYVYQYAPATILWKIIKDSDQTLAPPSQPNIPYVLTDEAVELVDWSQVTGKLLTLDDNVQYWHPEAAPASAVVPGARRVVGDERGNLKPQPAGGMVKILKEGFSVDGTAQYTPDTNFGAPAQTILAG